MFRGLRPDEIEVRVGTVGKKGASMLLYKDARCDMNILDETYGNLFWQRDHKEIKDNMYAGVGVYNKELGEWVWKWDCGTESNTEKEKGEASDSFKRACFNLGIGRELYTGGFIFIPCETVEISPGSNKFKLKDAFQFSGIKVTDVLYRETENKREIIGITIKDKTGNKIFQTRGFDEKSDKEAEKKAQEEAKDIGKELVTKVAVNSLLDLLQKKGEPLDLKRFGLKKIEDMTKDQYFEYVAELRAKK